MAILIAVVRKRFLVWRFRALLASFDVDRVCCLARLTDVCQEYDFAPRISVSSPRDFLVNPIAL